MIAGRDKPRPIFYTVHTYIYTYFDFSLYSVCFLPFLTKNDLAFINNQSVNFAILYKMHIRGEAKISYRQLDESPDSQTIAA